MISLVAASARLADGASFEEGFSRFPPLSALKTSPIEGVETRVDTPGERPRGAAVGLRLARRGAAPCEDSAQAN